MRRMLIGLVAAVVLATAAPSARVGAAPSPDALPRLGGAIVVHDASGHVFVTQRRAVAVYDLAGRRVGTIAGQDLVTDLVLEGETLYVLAAGDHEVNAFSAETLMAWGTWRVAGMSELRHMAKIGSTIWLTYAADGSRDGIGKLNLASGQVTVGTATVPGVADLVATSDPARLITVDRAPGHSRIRSYDVSSGTPVAVGASPSGVGCTGGAALAVAPSGESLWSACGAPAAFNEWDPAVLSGTATTHAASAVPNAVAVSGDGEVVVGGTRTSGVNDLWIYDAGDAALVKTHRVDPGDVVDRMVAVNGTGDRVYAYTTEGALRAIDLRPVLGVAPPSAYRYTPTTIAVRGRGFETVTSVEIDGQPTDFEVIDDDALTFYAGGRPIGTYPITITNHWASTEPSSVATLRVIANKPVPPSAPEITGTAPFEVSVGWNLAASDGGAAVTSWTVRIYRDGPGGQWSERIVQAPTRTATIRLPAEHRYGFRVAATNSSGRGAFSEMSEVVRVPTPDLGPFTSIPELIDQQHLDFLGRPPTNDERNHWLAALRFGEERPVDVIHALRDGSDNETHVDSVERLYFAYFGRPADAAGLAYWSAKHRRGTSLGAISGTFAASSEFTRTYGSLRDRAFVDLVYENVLGRPPDSAGASYWERQLAAGRATRGQVMVGFSESEEHVRARSAVVDAAAILTMLLGRSPTPEEFADAVASIESSGSTEDLVTSTFHGAAYAERIARLG